MVRIILILSVAAGLFSCNTADIKKGNRLLLPMDSGDKWEYEYDIKSNPKTVSFEITNAAYTFGQVMSTFDSFPCFGRDLKTEIVIRQDGSYEISQLMNFMLLPPPDKIKTGYKWESSEWKCRIVNDSEDLTILGKEYKDCVHITYSSSITFLGEMWLKEGVGIVKWQFLRTNPPTTELGHYLLKTYSIK